MTPEGKVKVKIKDWYKKNLPGHWRVSPRGGPFGKQGAPDDIICWRGCFIAIEVKSDTGEVSGMQMNNLKQIQAAGGVAAVVKGFDVDKLHMIRQIVIGRTPGWVDG